MNKLITWTVHFCLLFVVVKGLSQSKLENVEKYVEDVLQMLMFDLEDEGFCNLLMNDLNFTINEAMYGDEVVGNLRYFNGYVIGTDDVYIKPKSITSSLSDVNFEGSVSAIIIFKGLSYAYDMEAELSTGIQKATGIFKVDEVTYQMIMKKNLKTDVFTSYLEISGTTGKGRIDFQPKSYYTTVIARSFNGAMYETFREFGKGFLGDLLQNIVSEKINYPIVNYDTEA